MHRIVGLCLLATEINDRRWPKITTNVTSQTLSVIKRNGKWLCQRCQSSFDLTANPLDNDVAYCSCCMQFGKCQTNHFLYGFEMDRYLTKAEVSLEWAGTLMPQQKNAANDLKKAIECQSDLLIHGVTGAGKTEMLFPGIEAALKRQLTIAIVAPRIDVCLELYPRLSQVFPNITISLLYGGEKAVYGTTRFVIATIPQLFRFKNWFDLIIIDEVDAYPFYQNNWLLTGVKNAGNDNLMLVYLTATLTEQLKKELAQQGVKKISVPLRYHQHLLPVPICQLVKLQVGQNKLSRNLLRLLNKSIKQKQKLLIFCPTIKMVEKLFEVLSQLYPDQPIAFSHSQDSGREKKIQEMRLEKYIWFISTTILERGVTFYNIDVIVLQAHHRVFNEASLIQIAGRAGRSKDHPHGKVFFLCEFYTKEIKRALKGIKEMNRKGLALKRELIM